MPGLDLSMYEFDLSLVPYTIELLPGQTIVEHMDQQIFVMGVPRHLVTIRGQMILRAFGSIVFFKIRHLELGRYDHIRDQA